MSYVAEDPDNPVELVEPTNDTSNIITKTIVEQKKYNDIIMDNKIAAALATLPASSSSVTMVLGTVDTGEPNAIWIDYGT